MREACCLWAEQGANCWKDTEDEGRPFKIKGWIKALAVVCKNLHAQVCSFSVSLSEKEFIK